MINTFLSNKKTAGSKGGSQFFSPAPVYLSHDHFQTLWRRQISGQSDRKKITDWVSWERLASLHSLSPLPSLWQTTGKLFEQPITVMKFLDTVQVCTAHSSSVTIKCLGGLLHCKILLFILYVPTPHSWKDTNEITLHIFSNVIGKTYQNTMFAPMAVHSDLNTLKIHYKPVDVSLWTLIWYKIEWKYHKVWYGNSLNLHFNIILEASIQPSSIALIGCVRGGLEPVPRPHSHLKATST